MDLPDQIGDWARQDAPERYDRETIFDYIDGAGEVYRSYGFSNVFIARYARAGTPEISLELFDMGTSEDAYGVFSYAVATKTREVGIRMSLGADRGTVVHMLLKSGSMAPSTKAASSRSQQATCAWPK